MLLSDENHELSKTYTPLRATKEIIIVNSPEFSPYLKSTKNALELYNKELLKTVVFDSKLTLLTTSKGRSSWSVSQKYRL